MADLATLESALRKADAAGDTYAAKRFAEEIRSQRTAAPVDSAASMEALKEHFKSLDYKMAVARGEPYKPAQSLPEYAWEAMKQGVLPAAGTALGSIGGVPGQITGAMLGETANQALGIGHQRSVIPEADTPDLEKIGLTGAATAVVPQVLRGAGWLAQKAAQPVRSLYNMVAPGGEKAILSQYQKQIIGDENLPEVLTALREAKPFVPGSQPTAAEAVAHLPAGSPVVAHQKITAKAPGGISAQFGERTAEQRMARELASQTAKEQFVPMGMAALDRANATGVQAKPILQAIDGMASKPGDRASEVIASTLGATKDKISNLSNEGIIDARDLYTIRKELGNVITKFSKESSSWDKKRGASLEREIQRAIDDAVENAGGSGWKDYLSQYSGAMRSIADDLARKKLSLRPEQPTQLQSGVSVTEGLSPHLPNMLSRPAMLANAILSKISGGVEQRLDREAAKRYLNPQYMADELDSVPPRFRPMIEALMQQVPAYSAAMAAQERP